MDRKSNPLFFVASFFLASLTFLTAQNSFAAARAEVVSFRAVIFSEPSKSSKPVGRVSKGRKLVVSSKARNGFHKVRLKSKTGWVHESSIKIVGSASSRRKRSRRAFNRDQQPYEKEAGGASSRKLGTMSTIVVGPTVHLIGDKNAVETIVGADVSNFWSYGGEYAFNVSDSFRVGIGASIPFTQYTTENAINEESKVTLSGFMLGGSAGLLFAVSPDFIGSFGARATYSSLNIKKEDNLIVPNPQTYSASGFFLYLPEVKADFKLGKTIGIEILGGYRISTLGDFTSGDNPGAKIDSKLNGLLISAGLVIWL